MESDKTGDRIGCNTMENDGQGRDLSHAAALPMVPAAGQFTDVKIWGEQAPLWFEERTGIKSTRLKELASNVP